MHVNYKATIAGQIITYIYMYYVYTMEYRRTCVVRWVEVLGVLGYLIGQGCATCSQ